MHRSRQNFAGGGYRGTSPSLEIRCHRRNVSLSLHGVDDDVEVIIVGDAQPWVAVLFSHEHFPGVRFGHRIRAPSSELARYAPVWLKEEVETGALHRMMQNQPPR